ncbi:MAG: dockerin type I domain-containing protein [archaeon]|nr:dockerin type I domain-containing protein [archaeon]
MTVLTALLFIASASSADDGQAVKVSLSDGSTPGTIDVTIDENPGILSLRLSVDYDSSVMTLKEVIDGNLLPMTPSVLDGVPYILYGEGSDPNHAVTTTGLFATLVFEIKNSVEPGQYPVFITALESIDENLDDVDVSVSSGVISIGLPAVGDIDGNGKINAMDSLKLRKYLANDRTVSINLSNSDVNGDGSINSKDSILLRRYLAGNKDIFTDRVKGAELTVTNGGETYLIKGMVLDFPVFVHVSDSANMAITGNGTVESLGNGLYKIIPKESGCSFGPSVSSDYTVTVSVSGNGSVDKTTVSVPYGTTWSTSGNILTFSNGVKITATPATSDSQNTYTFDGWSKTSGTVTSDTSIMAIFSSSINPCTVTFSVNDTSSGSVDKTSVSVPYGTTWSVSGNVLTFSNGMKVTATAKTSTSQYTYSFTDWSKTSGTVTSNISIQAIFGSSVKSYTVTFSVNDTSAGSVDKTSVSVPYGTTWSVSGNTLTFSNGTKVTATAKTATSQYMFSFTNWSKTSGTVTSDTSIQANFGSSIRSYSVTISSNNTSYGTVSTTTVTLPYGTTWSVSGNTLTFSNSTKITATVKNSDYVFSNWSKSSGTVTSNTSIQAIFGQNMTYNPSIAGTKSFVGTYTINGTEYFLVYDGTMTNVILANKMTNNSMYLDSNTERCTWTNKTLSNNNIASTIGYAYGGYSWSDYSLMSYIESDSSVKSSIQGGLSALGSAYKGSFSSTHTYGASSVATFASKLTETSKTFYGYTVGKYVSYAVVGNVDVFTAYYLSNGTLTYTPIYCTYDLESKFVEFSGQSGYNKSLSKGISYTLSGNGSSSNPYLINNILDLHFVRSNLGSAFKLMVDLNIPGNWRPIGWTTGENVFSGTFDGNGHKISYKYTGSAYTTSHGDANYGFFLQSSGIIRNLTLDVNLNVTKPVKDDSWTYIGGLAGIIKGGTVENCRVNGNISTDTSKSPHKEVGLGGIAGKAMNNYLIDKCSNYATLKAYGNIASCGGIVGHCYDGGSSTTIKRCLSAGYILASGDSADWFCPIWHDGNAGGIVGSAHESNVWIQNCYVAVSKIEANSGANNHCAGIIGKTYNGTTTIADCMYTKGSLYENNSLQSDGVRDGGSTSTNNNTKGSVNEVLNSYNTYIKNNP